MANKRVRNNVK